MEGGPSHVDLFDPKPELAKYAGQPIPPSFHPETLGVTGFGTNKNGLLPSRRTFTQHGQSGLWISDWLPYIAEHADELAVIRSCQSNAVNHVGGVCQMNTGDILSGRPSMGAWVTYGLGSARRNLPTFIVMQDDKEILGGVQNYSSGFLPATFSGTLFRGGETPILNLKPPAGTTDVQERSKLEYLKALNERYARDKQDDSELDARTRSYELAYQMQSAAPEAIDLSSESEATKKLYGMDEKETAAYGTNCLMARRLVGRGVRFCRSLQRLLALGCAVISHRTTRRIANRQTSPLPVCRRSQGARIAERHAGRGAVSLGAPFFRERMMTSRTRSQSVGFTMFMAGGGVKAARLSARPTNWACAPWTNRITSTTSTRRFCTCWAWII
jgi:hypothetical protein